MLNEIRFHECRKTAVKSMIVREMMLYELLGSCNSNYCNINVYACIFDIVEENLSAAFVLNVK